MDWIEVGKKINLKQNDQFLNMSNTDEMSEQKKSPSSLDQLFGSDCVLTYFTQRERVCHIIDYHQHLLV